MIASNESYYDNRIISKIKVVPLFRCSFFEGDRYFRGKDFIFALFRDNSLRSEKEQKPNEKESEDTLAKKTSS